MLSIPDQHSNPESLSVHPYTNPETLVSQHPLAEILEEDIVFVSEDNYAFIQEDLDYMKTTYSSTQGLSKLRNPFTMSSFSENDRSALTEIIDFNELGEGRENLQRLRKERISVTTIQRLKYLADGLLVPAELHAQDGDYIETSQTSVEQFNTYYQNMNPNERLALDSYQIDSFNTFYPKSDQGQPLGIGIQGISTPISFREFYEDMENCCSHTAGAGIVKLVTQLSPEEDDWKHRHFIDHSFSEEKIFEMKAGLWCLCCCCPCCSIPYLFVSFFVIPLLKLIGVLHLYG